MGTAEEDQLRDAISFIEEAWRSDGFRESLFKLYRDADPGFTKRVIIPIWNAFRPMRQQDRLQMQFDMLHQSKRVRDSHTTTTEAARSYAALVSYCERLTKQKGLESLVQDAGEDELQELQVLVGELPRHTDISLGYPDSLAWRQLRDKAHIEYLKCVDRAKTCDVRSFVLSFRVQLLGLAMDQHEIYGFVREWNIPQEPSERAHVKTMQIAEELIKYHNENGEWPEQNFGGVKGNLDTWASRVTGVKKGTIRNILIKTDCYVKGVRGRSGSGLRETVDSIIRYGIAHGLKGPDKSLDCLWP